MAPNKKTIPAKDLIHGRYYQGTSRNAEFARWDGNLKRFVHWRYKFGEWFLDELCHPEHEQYFDAFFVEREVPAPNKEIPLE